MNDMTQQAPQTGQGKGHSLIAADRREITVRGVSEVISFDEANVRLVTTCGVLNLEGEGMRIHVLNLKDGIVAVTGQLNGVLYEEPESDPTGTSSRTAAKPRSRRLFG